MAPTTTTTTSPASANTVAPYSYGLTGVDIVGDNLDSSSFYLLIGLICIFVAAVRLFQLGSAHLRKITSFSSSPDIQLYWSRDPTTWWPSLKRSLIYAPLKHKRHNRELQLSSAVNMGTIPGRLQTLLLTAFLISQLIFMLTLDWSQPDKAALMAEIRGRSGHLSVLNMILLFLLAGRNNPFIRILRVSFDTFNLFHRWIGRIIILEALVHTFAWMSNKVWASGWKGVGDSFGDSVFIQYGLVSILAFVLILFQSPSPVRHAFYETFLHLHQFLAFLSLLGIYMHAKLGPLPQLPYIILIICLWVLDRAARWFRIAYFNFSPSRGLTKATIEALPGEACRVTFHTPRRWTPRPGAHVYVYLPGVSWWMSHPFSVAWSSDGYAALAPQRSSSSTTQSVQKPIVMDKEAVAVSGRASGGTSVSLVMLARSGMTRRLYDKARNSPGRTLRCTGFLEGPYGAMEDLHSYGTVMLFAGGVGITHNLPLLRDLLRAYDEKTTAVKRITLVWSFKDAEALEWVRPFMDEILAMPGRREVLRIMLFVTRPKSPREVVSASDRVQMFSGRANPMVLVRREFEQRVGAMSVGVCGPGVFADEARAAVREVVELGKVDFWEEAFTW